MTVKKGRPTFQETRKLHYIDRSEIAKLTGIPIDALWSLETTGRGTEETWQQVIDALNQLAGTDYEPHDFSDVTIANWPVIQVE